MTRKVGVRRIGVRVPKDIKDTTTYLREKGAKLLGSSSAIEPSLADPLNNTVTFFTESGTKEFYAI